MKHVIKILRVSFFFFASFWVVEGYSQAIISKKFTYGEYEPNLGKIVKIEQYKLGSLEVLPIGSLLSYSMWKFLTETGDSYYIQLECSSDLNDTILSTLISENDLIELIDSIYEMERAVQVDLKTDASYLESRFILFDNSSFGYFVSEGVIKWFIDFDEANDGSVVQILKIHETKRALEVALAKIEEHKKEK
jgi:hypothetical protein